MKKILFGLLATVLLASCSDKTAYTLVGSIEKEVADNTEVYLSEDKRGNSITDTTTIQNGTFAFSGTQAEPVVRFVMLAREGGKPRVISPVVLERGKVTMTVGEDKVTVAGTALNTKLQEYNDKLIYIDEAPSAENIVAFAKANINDVVGVYGFTSLSYMLNLEQLKDVLSVLPSSFGEEKAIVRIKKNVEAMEATKVGSKFTDIKGLSPDGKELALSDFAGKGKVVLVDFWASWCPPCRQEMPHLVDAYAKYKSKGFEIVGVSIDDKNDAWKKGISDLGITWPQFSDLKGWESELSKPYAVSSIPHTILIDKDGTIVAKQVSGKELVTQIEELLNK